MRINPAAVILWVFCALVGFLINDTTGAAWGATWGIIFSTALMFL